MTKECAILVNTRNRATELALLLQSLRTSFYQDFDVFILDDKSNNPNENYHFFNCLVNRLKQEGHKVFIKYNSFNLGVTRARQAIVDWALSIEKYEYLVRLDDDVIIEPDYLDRLKYVIERGYDMASGVTVPMVQPTFKRDPKFLKGIANRVILDEQGNYIMNGDDCGQEYTESIIIPAHHFRSCCMYKSIIHEKANYLPSKLSMNGFREEQIFSYRILMAGFKIGVDTKAVNWHIICPSGGERPTMDMVPFNQGILEEFTKENKEELNKLFTHEDMPGELELTKENNLIDRSKK
jgi:glycosyltransferase involved in cell wall biosynthesis